MFSPQSALWASVLAALCFICLGCQPKQEKGSTSSGSKSGYELMVLGIAQDAGFPQAACAKKCCTEAWKDEHQQQMVACLGLLDHEQAKSWMLDATPDFKKQQELLAESLGNSTGIVSGIFLTHAHMGHYTGLMHLGREAMGAKSIPVYAMPRMQDFLENNGPWSQLVKLNNISIQPMESGRAVEIGVELSVTPILVPHRDEFSETVGYRVQGPNKKALYIPDIDKWSRWKKSIEAEIAQVDYAFLDGTFFSNGELPNRDMSQIPHPFIEESITRFQTLPSKERDKIHFIHLNHSNPLIRQEATSTKQVKDAGMHIAYEGLRVEL